MLNLKEYREPKQKLSDHLPWAALIGPGLVLQKDELIQKSFRYVCHDLSCVSDHEVMAITSNINTALMAMDDGWSLFIEVQRREDSGYTKQVWDNPVGWLIDLERSESYEKDNHYYKSEYYMTFCWRLPTEMKKKFVSFFYEGTEEDSEDDEASIKEDIDFFLRRVDEMVNLMATQLLSIDELDDDETLTYLHSTISTHHHKVRAPKIPMYLDALLPDQIFTPAQIPMLGKSYMPVGCFVDFPADTYPKILSELDSLGFEYRFCMRWIAISQGMAKYEIEKYRKRWWLKRKKISTMMKEETTGEESIAYNQEAMANASDADEAIGYNDSNYVSFGYFTGTIVTWHSDAEQAEKNMTEIRKVLNNQRFVLKQEGLNTEQAWKATWPGNVYANVRRPMIHTLNLAHMIPLSSPWYGNQYNSHMKEVVNSDVPHMICNNNLGGRFYFNLNMGDLGHTQVIGPTGAGKSTLLSVLAVQWLRYKNSKVYFFDKDQSCKGFTLTCGGRFYEPGNKESRCSFQPLRKIDDPTELTWATDYVIEILRQQNLAVTPEQKKEVHEAMKSLSNDKVENRTFSLLTGLIQDQTIRNALTPYTLEGPYGDIFDADDESIDDLRILAFEMGGLMKLGKEAVVPALEYLFHMLEKRFNGDPTLLFIDEAWLFLRHSKFSEKIADWLTTVRKLNVYVIFATTEIKDAVRSEAFHAIMNSVATKIYLPNAKVATKEMGEIYKDMGLTDEDLNLIRHGIRQREYFVVKGFNRSMINLNLGEIALALLTLSGAKNIAMLDQIYQEMQEKAEGVSDTYVAEQVLMRKGLTWATEILQDVHKTSRYLEI